MTSPLVYDVTAQTFSTEVMERSMTVPVLIDFWAEWCGPCKTLGPILEKVVTEYDGAVVLAKVDSDAEVQLSQAFQVQSIPFVVLVQEGRPVDAFAGAVDEGKIREFLGKHGIEPAGGDAEPAEEDPDAPAARFRAARQAAAEGDAEGARAALHQFPEEDELAGDVANLLGGLDWLEADLTGEGEAVQKLGAARQHFLAGAFEDALQAIVDSAGADRSYGGGLARRRCCSCRGCWDRPMSWTSTDAGSRRSSTDGLRTSHAPWQRGLGTIRRQRDPVDFLRRVGAQRARRGLESPCPRWRACACPCPTGGRPRSGFSSGP